MNPEEEIILILSRPTPSDAGQKRVRGLTAKGTVDYDRLLRRAGDNGVSPFIFRNLTGDEGIPGPVVERLRTIYYQTLRRNLGHLNETLRLAGLLGDAGIGAVPLKGPLAAEQFFGDAGRYPTSDIDILVRPVDLGRARQVLEAAGYRNAERIAWEDLKTGTYHAVMTNGNYHIELHWNLAMRYFSVEPEFWWQKTSRTVHEGRKIIVLAPERYLLYLIFRAFAKGFFPLKYLVLAAGLIEAARKDFDWDAFSALAEECGMGRLAAFTLSFLRNELGVDCPAQVTGSSAGYRLFRKLVVSGLFTPGRRVHIRMLLYTLFLLPPKKSLPVLLRRLFPGFGEIRLRYGLPAKSKALYLYYLLNPVFLITKKGNR
ncbi:MAG: nucleotidyltransferase family protein [Nitrospiraceae bacterium]|nr:nucleotidyltransferase family protein [Nitrospiraceae bacterium]